MLAVDKEREEHEREEHGDEGDLNGGMEESDQRIMESLMDGVEGMGGSQRIDAGRKLLVREEALLIRLEERLVKLEGRAIVY